MTVENRHYWRCSTCEATFLEPSQRLGLVAERAHYLTHENAVEDPGYRRFLAKLATPLLDRLSKGARGIDFGCGPGPALAEMLREAGHPMALYDPAFAPDEAALSGRYDFITCTEVLEHLFEPAQVFDRFDAMLRPGGWLGLMTSFQTDDARFANWRYRREPTHVVFYRRATLSRIANILGWTCAFPVKNVALMRKPVKAGPDGPAPAS